MKQIISIVQAFLHRCRSRRCRLVSAFLSALLVLSFFTGVMPAGADPRDSRNPQTAETGQRPPAGTVTGLHMPIDRRDDEQAPQVERISIVGNRKTADSIIIHQLLLHEGDRFDELLANVSKIRLLGLGYFHSVKMSLGRGSRRGLVVWRIEVEERPTLLFTSGPRAHVGFSGAAFGFGLGDINFLGRGQTLLSMFRLRFDHQVVSVGWNDPHVFGSQYMVGLRGDLFHTERRIIDPDCDTRIEAEGITLLPFIGRQIGRFSRLMVGGKYSWISQEYRPDGLPAPAPGPFIENPRLASLGIAYGWSRKNDYFLPTKGYDFSASFEHGFEALGADYRYRKLIVAGEIFFPLAARQGVSFHLTGGVVNGTSPYFEKFNVANMVRGIWNFHDEWRETALAAQLEYRIRFNRGSRQLINRWEWVIFADAGNTWDRDDFKPEDLIYSFGTGARLDTRYGMINLVAALYSTYDHNEW